MNEQLELFQFLGEDLKPKVGDKVINEKMEEGTIISIHNGYIRMKFKENEQMVYEKAFKYFYKIRRNDG